MDSIINYLQCWWREKGIECEKVPPLPKPKPKPKPKSFSDDFDNLNVSNISCSNCFCDIKKETPYPKAKINNFLFGFCNRDCYINWLRCPNSMLIGKIN